MAIFDLSKKQISGIQSKSYTLADGDCGFANFLYSGGNGDLGAAEAIRLYYSCKPLFHAIKKRAGGFASIKPRVWNEKTKLFVDDHPILNSLKNPNPWQAYTSWAHELAEMLDVTGNTFPLATGDVNRPPLELFVDKSQTVSLSMGKNTYGFPAEISVDQENSSRSYDYEDVRYGDVKTARYYNKDKSGEIWQIRESNLMAGDAGMWGIPKAKPLWQEIEQFVASNTNNLSLLERGGQPSMGWTWLGDMPMTDDQFMRAREEVKKYTGAVNAGRQAIVDKLKPEPIAHSLRDMEFSVNRETMQKDIYTTYNIPLALIMDKSMTLDNLKTAEFLLWRDAILPLAGYIFGELGRFLIPRYGDISGNKAGDMSITFNPFDIEVMKRQNIYDVHEMKKIEVFTDNELRTQAGFDKLETEGSDSVWKPSMMIPAETPLMPGNTPTTNTSKSLHSDDIFIDSIKAMQLGDGTPLFTDAEIDSYLKGK